MLVLLMACLSVLLLVDEEFLLLACSESPEDFVVVTTSCFSCFFVGRPESDFATSFVTAAPFFESFNFGLVSTVFDVELLAAVAVTTLVVVVVVAVAAVVEVAGGVLMALSISLIAFAAAFLPRAISLSELLWLLSKRATAADDLDSTVFLDAEPAVVFVGTLPTFLSSRSLSESEVSRSFFAGVGFFRVAALFEAGPARPDAEAFLDGAGFADRAVFGFLRGCCSEWSDSSAECCSSAEDEDEDDDDDV